MGNPFVASLLDARQSSDISNNNGVAPETGLNEPQMDTAKPEDWTALIVEKGTGSVTVATPSRMVCAECAQLFFQFSAMCNALVFIPWVRKSLLFCCCR